MSSTLRYSPVRSSASGVGAGARAVRAAAAAGAVAPESTAASTTAAAPALARRAFSVEKNALICARESRSLRAYSPSSALNFLRNSA
eukprot:7385003-Prymnesium_polylepis.1